MINLGESQVVDALVVMVVVVVIDDGADRRLKFTLQVAVLQQDAILESPLVALDLALLCG